MPIYNYLCPLDHSTTQRGGYEDATIPCPKCSETATRVPVYRDQGVIFAGTGFTRTVIPPAPPHPPSVPELTPDEHFEVMDKYAEDQYKDEINYRPERDKVLKKARKDAADGKIF